MSTGNDIRKEKLTLRNRLDIAYRDKKSRIIQEKVLQLREMMDARSVFIYVSFRSEVSTLWLLEKFLEQGKEISVPVTYVKKKRMDAIRVEDIAKDLEPGYCGILEPTKAIAVERVMNPRNIDVVIVPGSVFDERGGRFGYGGGYYDRFLAQIPEATRIGLSFEMQVVEKAPLEKHDQLLDYTITEKRIIKGR